MTKVLIRPNIAMLPGIQAFGNKSPHSLLGGISCCGLSKPQSIKPPRQKGREAVEFHFLVMSFSCVFTGNPFYLSTWIPDNKFRR
jgi:hypothetical protein